MTNALKGALALILFLCSFPLAFLMLTDKIQEKSHPGSPYALNLSTGCFEEKHPRLILRLKELECLTPEERQALLNPAAPSQTVPNDSAGAERLREAARAKVMKAQELYQQRVDAHEASRAASLLTMKDPMGTFVKRVTSLFE
ncbi:hypothetical protein D3C71_19190 [compost metagenome]